MDNSLFPAWMSMLDPEDLVFIRRFLLASGSLKEVAGQYGVSYPTVRQRLDRLIGRIGLGEEPGPDPYVDLIRKLAVGGKLDSDTARLLISRYRRIREDS